MTREDLAKPAAAHRFKTKSPWLMAGIVIVLAILLSGLYLGFSWNRYQNMKEEEAIQLAASVEALLPIEHGVMALNAAQRQEAVHIAEEHLSRLVETTSTIHYAYILAKHAENFIVLADSAGAAAGHARPTKRSCEQMSKDNRMPFETGRSVLNEPVKTPCGTWIRALTPIFDEAGDVALVLGLSYAAQDWRRDQWKRMMPDIMIVLCLLFLLSALLYLRWEHGLLKEKSEKLLFQESLYRKVFEQAPIGIALVDNQKDAVHAGFSSINPMGEAILGRDRGELVSITWQELTHPEDLQAELAQFERFMAGETDAYVVEKRIMQPDGSTVWANVRILEFSGGAFGHAMYLCLMEDISARKASEQTLEESERSKAVLLSHLPGMAYRAKHDRFWTFEFASAGCRALTGYAPESLIHNRDVSYREIIAPEYRRMILHEWARVLAEKKSFRAEYELITASGERKWVMELGQGVYDAADHVEAVEGIVLDIAEQKEHEARIAYLSKHDYLTGLYNRRHLEKEMKTLDKLENWPISVAICNIDGLRVINDAYGHAEGDRLIRKTAKLILDCCRTDSDILGRTSGDEFMLVMLRTDSQAAHVMMEKIRHAVSGYNRLREQPRYELSLSIGYSTKESDGQSIEEVLKAAEKYLKRRKLINRNSSHHAIVTSIMATLYAKSQETEEHGERLGDLCRMIGERLELASKALDDLHLLSMLHDIGKIGVDDRILNKPGKLTAEEWMEMRRHPEIGHRIARSTPQLEHIAEYILHHHERWDGAGYPVGLKGSEIPLLSRILAVADAYDAMIEDRVYRKAMPAMAALDEIRRGAGTQFDPDIAMLFIELMTERAERDRP